MNDVTVGGDGSVVDGDTLADLVALVTERALALAGQSPRAPSSVRISAGSVQVEICWRTGRPGPVTEAPAGVPAAAAQASAAVAAAAPGTPGAPADGRPGDFPLCAGTVGTFYRAPEPGAAPFVTEGDEVRPGQQVAIIEAMKLMIPVEAERAGKVMEFLVTDRGPVEFGQPLILMREVAASGEAGQ
jgi:acetyl-CoA carboxylase biotin carboxyl carrier protein